MVNVKVLVESSGAVGVCSLPDGVDIPDEHKAKLVKIIDLGLRDNIQGICADDMGSHLIHCWKYDSVSDKIVLDKNLLAVYHLDMFRQYRVETFKKLDYKMIDAGAAGNADEVASLTAKKVFLRNYPDELIANLDRYSIDYLKSLPSELFM